MFTSSLNGSVELPSKRGGMWLIFNLTMQCKGYTHIVLPEARNGDAEQFCPAIPFFIFMSYTTCCLKQEGKRAVRLINAAASHARSPVYACKQRWLLAWWGGGGFWNLCKSIYECVCVITACMAVQLRKAWCILARSSVQCSTAVVTFIWIICEIAVYAIVLCFY
jgi:hypothetical protein